MIHSRLNSKPAAMRALLSLLRENGWGAVCCVLPSPSSERRACASGGALALAVIM